MCGDAAKWATGTELIKGFCCTNMAASLTRLTKCRLSHTKLRRTQSQDTTNGLLPWGWRGVEWGGVERGRGAVSATPNQ